MLDVTRQPDTAIKTIRHFIDGAFVEAQSGRVFDKSSPVSCERCSKKSSSRISGDACDCPA